jgi:mono/diheme cytochrome c family protein
MPVLFAAALFAAAASAQSADLPGGPTLFRNHCAACHGEDGRGGGPAAPVMRVPVPNLRTLAARNGGTFPADAVTAHIDGRQMQAAHGDRQMPVWGDVFRTGEGLATADRAARERVAAVVKFLEVIQEPLPRAQ